MTLQGPHASSNEAGRLRKFALSARRVVTHIFVVRSLIVFEAIVLLTFMGAHVACEHLGFGASAKSGVRSIVLGIALLVMLVAYVMRFVEQYRHHG